MMVADATRRAPPLSSRARAATAGGELRVVASAVGPAQRRPAWSRAREGGHVRRGPGRVPTTGAGRAPSQPCPPRRIEQGRVAWPHGLPVEVAGGGGGERGGRQAWRSCASGEEEKTGAAGVVQQAGREGAAARRRTPGQHLLRKAKLFCPNSVSHHLPSPEDKAEPPAS
ncbi:hypothetical protein PVAP13_5NG143681 [Panicum virgatum]|uniref:Uncharacterized protein n=1 Tax=Panicum virgatum TaxID=38727 RepID=A0A8T0RMI3_PANVG|nr:hypothetical protein PVAP13_5NG143681 [Panicum virgatum]